MTGQETGRRCYTSSILRRSRTADFVLALVLVLVFALVLMPLRTSGVMRSVTPVSELTISAYYLGRLRHRRFYYLLHYERRLLP